MPLPMPKLDNRTFDQLVAEGRGLIPRYAPNWTDYNFHDPGITLLELFAWLTEMNIYRLDHVPEASFRTFLRLVGVELRPAQVAETVLVFDLQAGSNPVSLPVGLQVGKPDGTIVFQTTSDVHVSPAQMVAVLTPTGDQSAENRFAGALYHPFGQQPAPGHALYLGFDRPLADSPIEVSLYVWTGTPEVDQETRQQLIAEWEAARDEAEISCPPGIEPDVPDWQLHYSARTVWEYRAGDEVWVPLTDVTDETRGLTLSGAVRFTAPVAHVPGGPIPEPYFIRCRLLGGSYECPPEIDRIAINAVVARHAADIEAETALGVSNGWANQKFQVAHTPVVPASTRLRVVTDGKVDDSWREVAFWDVVGPHDQAYQLLPVGGEIHFGDGRRGHVPPADGEIRVTYQIGSGPKGNVNAGTLSQALPHGRNAALISDWVTVQPHLRVQQPFAASGGALAETLSDAKGRAWESLNERHRAVTLPDFEKLAKATPGVPVAQARALPDYYPALPCFPAPGCVTVVVVPRCPDPRPTPSEDFLRAVKRYLERRRTLATALYVIGPNYTRVVVHARLHVEPRTNAEALTEQAQKALDWFFHPLHGGPDGDGWPIGRDVYRGEVMEVLSDLPGVVYVDQFGLQTEGDAKPRCENLPICPNHLVASGQHQIHVVERSTI